MDLVSIVNTIFNVYVYLVIARVLISWVPHNPSQPIFKFIYEVTDPVMKPISRLIPAIGGIDFSPIIVIIVIELVQRLVIGALISFLY